MNYRMQQLTYLIAGALCLGAFQNCAGKSSQFEDVISVQAATFFSYPYASAPQYYMDMQLYSGASGLTLAAALSNPNDSVDSITYNLQLQASDGTSIGCAASSGSLAAGTSSIQLTCSPTTMPAHYLAILTAGSGSSAVTVQKTF